MHANVYTCLRAYVPRRRITPCLITGSPGGGGFDRSRDGGKGDIDLPYYIFVNERMDSLFSGLCVTRLGLVFKVNGTVWD